MGIVPKGPRAGDAASAAATAKVRDIGSAKSKGGRPSGLGFDPSTGEEVYAQTYRPESEYDVFGTVRATGYSEDRFYTRSVNADGHGERITVRVPQGIDSQLYAAVADIPEYRSIQDLFRDAVMHRLEYLQKRHKLSEDAIRMLVLERYRADSDRRSQEIDNLTAAVESIEEKCQKAWTTGDYQLLAEELERGGETMEWLREPYKGRAEGILKEWKQKARGELERLERAKRE